MRLFFVLCFITVAPTTFADQVTPPAHVGDQPKLVVKGRDALPPVDPGAACRAKFVLDESKLTDLERKMWTEVKDGKSVAFEAVTEAWIEKHLRDYNTLRKTDYTPLFIRRLLYQVKMGGSDDPFQFKADAETRLEKLLLKKHLVYNSEFDSPIDMVTSGKAQCYAGSVCYSWLGRLHWGREGYLSKRPVMVFTKGHVFPAFVLPDDKGDDWLVGVETTSAGNGKNTIAKMSELDKQKGAYRVVDATTYALMEIFKAHLKPDALECWQKQAMKETAKALGFDLAKTEAKVEAEIKASTGKSGERTGLLGFGIPSTPPGDRARGHFGDAAPAVLKGGGLFIPAPPPSTAKDFDSYLKQREALVALLTKELKKTDVAVREILQTYESSLSGGMNEEQTKAVYQAVDEDLAELTKSGLRSSAAVRGYLRAWGPFWSPGYGGTASIPLRFGGGGGYYGFPGRYEEERLRSSERR